MLVHDFNKVFTYLFRTIKERSLVFSVLAFMTTFNVIISVYFTFKYFWRGNDMIQN